MKEDKTTEHKNEGRYTSKKGELMGPQCRFVRAAVFLGAKAITYTKRASVLGPQILAKRLSVLVPK